MSSYKNRCKRYRDKFITILGAQVTTMKEDLKEVMEIDHLIPVVLYIEEIRLVEELLIPALIKSSVNLRSIIKKEILKILDKFNHKVLLKVMVHLQALMKPTLDLSIKLLHNKLLILNHLQDVKIMKVIKSHMTIMARSLKFNIIVRGLMGINKQAVALNLHIRDIKKNIQG